MESYADTEHSFSELERLKVLLGDHYQVFSPSLEEVDHESWVNMTDQEKKKKVKNVCGELAASVDKWSRDHLYGCNSSGIFDWWGPGWWVFTHIISILWKIACWEFGTMPNILQGFQDPAIPKDMTLKEPMHLVDAGLYLNSPYPSVLGKARGIDLIISFDFSEDDKPFKTLKVASEYAAATCHPFPKVVEPKDLKSYYVFEEKDKPTVIHIPLFNTDNCKDPETIKKEMKEYTTFQLPYKDEAKIDHLAHLAEVNVSMNKDHILKEIKKAVQRRSRH
ncbi:cytosolic phospholipase A2 gamma-like [Clupea harengus]|uniref:Cytosolic phospholipase A2 gamma-like n=1 Tax=Clupea harengus TaxID=7950 RepID=A0A8M1KBT2_CLUHA|nr:cytosolic phospholipase A2 gamma-like [Clupea harengus]